MGTSGDLTHRRAVFVCSTKASFSKLGSVMAPESSVWLRQPGAGYSIIGNTCIARALTAVRTSAELINSEHKLFKDEKESCRDDEY